MATELPYLPTYKNVGLLFEKIAAAKQPDAFTHSFLTETLGLKSTGDRALIPLLRNLGFLDASNKPTREYSLLKNKTTARTAIARGVKTAYEGLFTANEKAHELPQPELRGLIGQVAGVDDAMTGKILGTFNALIKQADFSVSETAPKGDEAEKPEPDEEDEQTGVRGSKKQLRPEFHYNIQVHLPPNGSQETYLNIFNAIREVFNE